MQRTSSLTSRSEEAVDTVKILTLGAHGVGKTCLISVFNEMLNNSMLDSFSTILREARATIGVDFVRGTFKLSEDRKVKLNIWDTAGQEKYRSISRNLYTGSKGILICFDLTNTLTEESIQGWMDEVRQHVKEECSQILVGTKCDGIVNQKTIDVLTKFSAENNLEFIQTSSLNGTNVYSAFETLIQIIDKRMGGKLGLQGSSMRRTLSTKDPDIGRSCC